MPKLKSNIPVITVDGPAGSGKGTISNSVAQKKNWHLLDSGALYRLVALDAVSKNINLDDSIKLENLANNLDVEFKPVAKGHVQIYLEGRDVTTAIRTEDCGNCASKVAAIKGVRVALLSKQQNFAKPPGLVADGRDMGTVVFPQAGVKIFLTASPEIRAERRLMQLKEQGISANVRGLIRDIEQRDARDINRKDSPLVPADDAIIINTDFLSIDEVVNTAMEAISQVY